MVGYGVHPGTPVAIMFGMNSELQQYATDLAVAARQAGRLLAVTSGQQRTDALLAMAQALQDGTDDLVAENAKDVAAAKDMGLTAAMIDRLRLDADRVAKMAKAVAEVAAQPDPVGQVIEGWVRPNGLRIEKRRVPMGAGRDHLRGPSQCYLRRRGLVHQKRQRMCSSRR